MWELSSDSPRTVLALEAVELFNAVQLCKEMGWTEAELLSTSDDFVWACSQVLSLQAQRDKERIEDNRSGSSGSPRNNPLYRPRTEAGPPPGMPRSYETKDDSIPPPDFLSRLPSRG